jgi:hypothetical protein
LRRIRNGWSLTKKSWGILRENPGLVQFPVAGAITAIVLAIATFIPAILLLATNETALVVIGFIVLIIGVILVLSTAIFFAVALAHNADRLLAGEDPTFGDGVTLARKRLGAIFAWAFISTVVGTIIQAIQDRLGVAGIILGGLAGAAWAVLTFLAIPVIAIEGTGGFRTVKRCAELIRSRWGEQITGTAAIGLILFIIGYLPAALVLAGGIYLIAGPGLVAVGAVVAVIGLIGLAIIAVIGKALITIFGVALYRFVAEDRAVGTFTEEELAGAVASKNGMGGMPPGVAGTTV